MKFIFVRHGHTIYNKLGLTQGWCDSPLTRLGKSQVKALKEKISDIPIDYVYSSPSKRAIKTASLLCDKEIVIDKRLMEINFGTFEQLPVKLRLAFHIESKHWTDDFDMNYEICEGENLKEVIQRQKEFLFDIISKHDNKDTILIVGHGCSLYGLIKSLLSEQIINSYPEFKFLSNAAAVIVEENNNYLNIIDIIN